MKTFTFITIAYNHEKYIIEHLESIKKLVITYGKNIGITYKIFDDCSRDNTIEKVNKWLKGNGQIFDQIEVVQNKTNMGIVNNYINAISSVRTDAFKVLAGDDKYLLSDIFSLLDRHENEIIFTPVVPFGGSYSKIVADNVNSNFRLLLYMWRKEKISNLVKIDNFIAAPGAFIPRKYAEDKEFIKYLQQFRWIEDYPSWQYFIVKKGIRPYVDQHACINYRVGSGITSKKTNNSPYDKEQKFIYKSFKVKAYILPKYINPYRYYLYFLRKRSRKAIPEPFIIEPQE